VTVAARKIRLIMELRRAGIGDTHVLSAIERIPREAFVPEAFQDQAYENRALPIDFGQTLSQPGVVAAMTQALNLDRRLKVLEVGTGSGYQAAILSRLCRRLYSVERYKDLQRAADARFQQLRLHNITTRVGDGHKGWPEQAPFSRIIVTAAAAEVPGTLVDQLSAGGVMVVPVGQTGRDQSLLRLHRDEEGHLHEQALGPVRFVPLVQGLPAAQDGAAAADWSGPRRATLA
jgi:protein-L-isoaspartate(D-aspartate) O-methyltransferase